MSTATLSASGLAHYCGELDRTPERSIDVHEQADAATRAARNAIKAIPNISEREFCALIASITAAMTKCGFSHMEYATEAMEYLTSAHAVLEAAAEKHE
jgi:predicted class III extradiol MEMO1 family dioxygenase